MHDEGTQVGAIALLTPITSRYLEYLESNTKCLEHINKEFKRRGLPEIRTGIGLRSGRWSIA